MSRPANDDAVSFAEERHDNSEFTHFFPEDSFENRRKATAEELEILLRNGNRFLNGSENSFWVPDGQNLFYPERIVGCEFSGTVILGQLTPGRLCFHDLNLETGLYFSYLENCRIGDNCVIRNVRYLSNYSIGNYVILFNIEEMSCTPHSKFGNGILKEGEPESARIWIDVRNENGGRAVLPFEGMVTGDAWLWSRFRDDRPLMDRFFEMTEKNNDGKQNVFGILEDRIVIKNTRLIKDVKVMSGAYIKGALKLKNMTVCSSPEEPSQIGEGVEMVNGIMGAGSKVFYQAVAVRFVLGRNCQLKYGARLLHSVLGDNSTVSCCELLNNLIFPFHEQHHNTSFLIAAEIRGQSNLAAGATAGSNHNSRSPDGELIAGRGFWPGLSTAFTHNSRFASFCLAARGSYLHPLDIVYPFSLISINGNELSITPAFWFTFNMYAVARNRTKFGLRDRRAVRKPYIETDPIAPDTVAEMTAAMRRLEQLTGEQNPDDSRPAAALLADETAEPFVLTDTQAQKRYGATVIHPGRAWREYRRQLLLFAVRTVIERKEVATDSLRAEICAEWEKKPRYTEWENVGGQLIPSAKVKAMTEAVKKGGITDWEGVHRFYEKSEAEYPDEKLGLAMEVIRFLYGKPLSQWDDGEKLRTGKEAAAAAEAVYEAAAESRKKDYSDRFRRMVYGNSAEQAAVLKTFEEDTFLKQLRRETDELCERIGSVFGCPGKREPQ